VCPNLVLLEFLVTEARAGPGQLPESLSQPPATPLLR